MTREEGRVPASGLKYHLYQNVSWSHTPTFSISTHRQECFCDLAMIILQAVDSLMFRLHRHGERNDPV